MLRWRREKRRERREVGCKLTVSFDRRTKKVCELDKWVIY